MLYCELPVTERQLPLSDELSAGGMRHRQKNRTRRALVNATAELLRQGRDPTVAEVAEIAEVSRATAYRYFPSREALLLEIKMFAPDGPMDVFDRVASETDDPVERVGILAREVAQWAVDNEPVLRTLLRLSLDPQTGVHRPGHRVRWIAEVLEPLRGEIEEASLERLSAALTLVFGIDPVVSLTEFAGLGPEQVVEVIEWVARTLVRCVVQDSNRVREEASLRVRAGPSH